MTDPLVLQQQIVSECSDPNNTLNIAVSTIWDLSAANAGGSVTLQYLYTKRACLDIRLAEEQPDTDFTVGQDVTDKQSQRWQHLQQMREDVQAEIVRVEGITRAQGIPVIAKLTTTEPIAPPSPSYPDPADPFYAGFPYRRCRN